MAKIWGCHCHGAKFIQAMGYKGLDFVWRYLETTIDIDQLKLILNYFGPVPGSPGGGQCKGRDCQAPWTIGGVSQSHV